MGFQSFHIYTDHWWRNPKHAVTTEATLVEVKSPKRPTGTVTSGPYNPSPSGYFQEVFADVTDPKTGEVVRAHGDLYFSLQAFQVGQRLRVRWSAKRKEIDVYNENTAPEGEWNGEDTAGAVALGGAIPGVGAVPVAGLSSDQSARVQQALSTLGLGNVADVQVVQAGGGQPDSITQLERLAELHQSGALTDAEFDQQKHQLLGES